MKNKFHGVEGFTSSINETMDAIISERARLHPRHQTFIAIWDDQGSLIASGEYNLASAILAADPFQSR